jgi:hypothetical protein
MRPLVVVLVVLRVVLLVAMAVVMEVGVVALAVVLVASDLAPLEALVEQPSTLELHRPQSAPNRLPYDCTLNHSLFPPDIEPI